MFLDLNKTIKFIKQAYRKNLRIGNIEGKTIITSGYWLIAIENDKVPNKIKAIIMELAGELPKPGILFEVTKEYSNPQICINKELYLSIMDNVKKANHKMYMTPLSLTNGTRLLQTQIDGMVDMHGVSEEYLSMIDKTCIDHDIEGEPTGPCCIEGGVMGIYWYNSSGMVVIYPIRLPDSEMINALCTVDFKEDK